MSEPTQFPDPVRAQILPRACGSTGAILAAIQRSDLDQPTPCASWKVRDVVNHILGGAAYFAELAEAGAVADRAEEEPDLTAGDFSGTFRARGRPPGRRLQRARCPGPGAGDAHRRDAGLGAAPGSRPATSSPTAGTWPRRPGQPTDLEPELAAAAAGPGHPDPARLDARPGGRGAVRARRSRSPGRRRPPTSWPPSSAASPSRRGQATSAVRTSRTSPGVNPSVASPTVSSMRCTAGSSVGTAAARSRCPGRRPARGPPRRSAPAWCSAAGASSAPGAGRARRARRPARPARPRSAGRGPGTPGISGSRRRRQLSAEAACGHSPNRVPPIRCRHSRTSARMSAGPATQQPASAPRPL